MYLNYKQLRSARSVLNLGVRDIGCLIHASRTTISKLENGKVFISLMRLGERRNAILLEFFKKNQIVFPNDHSIKITPNNNLENIKKEEGELIITRFQLRASRAILEMTQEELSKKIHSPASLIKKAEQCDNLFLLKKENFRAIEDVVSLFKKRGMKFISPFTVEF